MSCWVTFLLSAAVALKLLAALKPRVFYLASRMVQMRVAVVMWSCGHVIWDLSSSAALVDQMVEFRAEVLCCRAQRLFE